MYKEILEDWETMFFHMLACFDESRNDVFDHDDIVHDRREHCRRHTKTDERLLEVYEEYLRERNRRKEEFDKWLELEMNRNRDRNEFD